MMKVTIGKTIAQLLLFSAALLLLTNRGSAEAHALLLRSNPAANAELAEAPASIEFWFSEPLEAKFSTAHLVDVDGNEITGESIVDPSDATHLTLHLGRLEPGIYTVVYHSLSQADGHEWTGSFPLILLNSDGSRPEGAPVGAGVANAQANPLPGPIQIGSRWLSLLGAMLLLAVVLFERLIAIPNTTSEANELFSHALRTSLNAGMLCGIMLLFAGLFTQVLSMTQSLNQNSTLFDLIAFTRIGNLLVFRLLLVGLFLLWLGRWRRGSIVVRWIYLMLGLVLLASFSLTSHAAAVPGSGWAMLGDFVHLFTATLWVGSLFVLALLLWQVRQSSDTQTSKMAGGSLHFIVRRFSAIATLSVFVLLCSGIFSSLVQLPSVSLLWTTIYGWVLLGKVLLMLLMLAVAFFNFRFVRRGEALSGPQQRIAYRSFALRVWAEALIGLLLMVAVAVLVQIPLPKAADAEAASDFFESILIADDLNIHLQILPNQVGDNQYIAHLYHTDGSAVGEVQLVRLSFQHKTAALGQSNIALGAKGSGIFDGRGAYLSQAGSWDVTIYIRRRGMDDALAQTTVDVPIPGALGSANNTRLLRWQNPIATLPVPVVIGSVIVMCLFAVIIGRQATRLRHQ